MYNKGNILGDSVFFNYLNFGNQWLLFRYTTQRRIYMIFKWIISIYARAFLSIDSLDDWDQATFLRFTLNKIPTCIELLICLTKAITFQFYNIESLTCSPILKAYFPVIIWPRDLDKLKTHMCWSAFMCIKPLSWESGPVKGDVGVAKMH